MPHDPAKHARVTKWFAHAKAQAQTEQLREIVILAEELIRDFKSEISFLETEMTRVGKVAAAATAALAAVPPPTDPSLIIDADDVKNLGTLAAAVKVDPTTGDPIPVVEPTPAPAPAA